MAKLKKGSAAAKAFMAKLRAARGKTKVKTGAVKKVMPTKKASSMHKDTKSHNVNIRVVSGTDKNTERLEYGQIYDTYLQLYLVKFANLSFSVWAVTGEGLTKALKHPEGKNQAPIVYRVKSYGIPKFEKMTIKELKDFK
jgi:ribosomal protein S26